MAKLDGPRVGGANAKEPKGQVLGHKAQVLHSGMGQTGSVKMWGRKARALSPTPAPSMAAPIFFSDGAGGRHSIYHGA